MTPKMVAALEAAELADAKGGLRWTVAGWAIPGDHWSFHGPIVVSRLVWHHGYLAEAGKGRGENARRVITEKGRKFLEERRAAKPRKPRSSIMSKAEDLERLIGRLEEAMAAIDENVGPMPEFGVATFEARSKWFRDYHDAFFDLAQTLITEEQARINTTGPDGHAIRMAGIRSSSTGGWSGALRNWQRAARKKIEEAR